MPQVDKNRPSQEWIEHLRRRFPCESEIDRVLTRKMQRRSGPPYVAAGLETLIAGTRALIASQEGEPFEITDARWLSGGASKLQMAFTFVRDGQATPLVLRMEPSESNVETSRLREYQIIAALRDHLPVPKPHWVDHEARHLPYPAIVYGFVPGVAKPSGADSQVSGIGTYMPPALREPLGAQFVQHLAHLHTFDWRQAELSAFDKPTPGTQALEWKLNHWERVWEEDVHEDIPLMRLAMAWLRSNMPPVDHVSVTHGDYRTGNFLFTESDARISAWLDWELASLGDRHEDLVWASKPAFGRLSEDGKTLLVGGMLPVDSFFSAYEEASGLPVVPEKLRYYEVFNNYKCVVICLATGLRAARNGKTHQDVLVTYMGAIGYQLVDELRAQLEALL